LVNGQWVMDVDGYAGCADGSTVPNAALDLGPKHPQAHSKSPDKVPVCGNPAGFTFTNNVQLRQA
jgi:hypothetical protein